MSDAAGLDVSYIAVIAVTSGYRFVYLECNLWGFLIPYLYRFYIVTRVFQSILVVGILGMRVYCLFLLYEV
jgi:hypothetical protein